MNYSVPTESINQYYNQKNNQDQSSKSNDDNANHSRLNSNLKVALTLLGIASASIYTATKIKKIKKIKINKPYNGKYLEKKK